MIRSNDCGKMLLNIPSLVLKYGLPMTKAQRLLTAFKLHMTGVQMKKMQLKRKHPNSTPEEIQILYSKWVRENNPLPNTAK